MYTLQELKDLRSVCDEYGLYLFLDGARLGYALTAKESYVTLKDLAELCDVFYIGGTKVGALFGEAVVIRNPAINEDFRYLIKQKGAMLAKGRLLGLQFDTLFTDDLYFQVAEKANRQAEQIRQTLHSLGYRLLVDNGSNQIFPILPDALLDELSKNFTFTEQERVDDHHRAVRFCTSWATKQENVDALCSALCAISEEHGNL